MRKLLYILPVILILGFAACENYVDITPTGKKTVDSTDTYYELIALPNRAYHPAAFALLSDNVWSKESNIIGNEFISWDGINMTFNEAANRKELSDASLGDKDVKELAKAEAKIMRAWDHFILINTFAKAYNPETAATDGGVAIIDKYDLEATPTKSTVAQVYDFIIKDIEEALPYLQEEPVNVYHPSKAFGYALAARVYLFHRDWKKAKEAAEESLKLNNTLIDYIDLGAKGGPTKVTTYAKGGNPEVLNYAYMGGPTEVLAFCYGMLSPEMVQLFGQNDERLNQFFKTSDNSIYYFDEGSGAALWNTSITYSKFQPMSVGMRTAEVYLILAEAKARLKDIPGAVQTLNQLREKRIKGAEAVLPEPATERAMVQAVIDERRKELISGFSRFWDLKRYNTEADYAKTITRTFPLVSTDVEKKTYTLKPDSRLYIIPFPLAAREKNPNLTMNTNE